MRNQLALSALTITASLLVAVPAEAAGTAATGTATLTVSRACPGGHPTVTETGFADGSYQLNTAVGTFSPRLVTVSGGRFSTTPVLTLPATPAREFTITATPQAGGAAVAQRDVILASPDIEAQNAYSQPTILQTGDCFTPGEQVTIDPSATISAPATVTADSRGRISVEFTVHPAQQLSYPSATLTGRNSGQSGIAQFYPLPGTTLFAGQAISEDVYPKGMNSANFGYEFFPVYGELILQPVVGGGPLWTAGYDPKQQGHSKLVMQDDGNLVYSSGGGAVLWASHTAGTGSNNRLILQNDGNLVMFTGGGTPIWSSQAGVIGAPNNLHSYAFAASSRPLVELPPPPSQPGVPVKAQEPKLVPGSAVYVNGLIKQAVWTGALARGVGRTVYLQRYLNGQWQNLLARTTNSTGQFSVGFIQPKAYVYRLLLVRTGTATGATSSPFIR